ncbi:hypothetical protein CHS0354_024618 [Potamilus streckersoni]|uniref:F-box domain-containing protein n=1 Tax=Potamilus streckersoni TaxID=2493646 RepID=A0AAE0S362_9BIVA|nr:hypothetical protein CHS0354_024618 [Potamilus streckersoni]
MPFLGRDWRSPGDQWVKTSEGWERLKLWRVKVFESLNENFIARLMRLALDEWDEDRSKLHNVHQPHVHFIRGTTRERKVLTSISEAFIHLDMTGACKDIRRFNYVCKLIELLLLRKMGEMSGAVQRKIFNILEEMLKQVLRTQINKAALSDLLDHASRALTDNRYHHIGSTCLWDKHTKSVNNMVAQLDNFSFKERKEDGKVTLSDLPSDCIRCILMKLCDHKDVVNLGRTNQQIHTISQENLLWKRLCFFHFTNRQLLIFLPPGKEEYEVDWKYIYHRCVKRFGKKDVYADTLALCKHCDSIFWQSIGHPCMNEKDPPRCTPLTPEALAQLFNL